MHYTPGRVTVVTPTIPIRPQQLARAMTSVMCGTRPPDSWSIEVDREHRGAGPTRTAALRRVTSEWTAFIDDDDEWYPQHLERLLDTAAETEADVVYPWFDIKRPDGHLGETLFPEFEGQPWDPAEPHLFPICALVRTELAHGSAFPEMPRPVKGPHGQPENPDWCGDDWPFWCGVFAQGAKVHHLNERTWAYWHWGISSKGRPVGNTSGRGDRW